MRRSDIFAQKLYFQRRRAGLTQQELANFLRMDRSTYTYYERGKTKPSYACLLKLSELYALQCEYFIDDQIAPGDYEQFYKQRREDTGEDPIQKLRLDSLRDL